VVETRRSGRDRRRARWSAGHFQGGLIAGFAPVTRGEDRDHVALMAIVRDVSTGPSRGFIFIDVNGERGSIAPRCYVLETKSWMAGSSTAMTRRGRLVPPHR
jgi:hypothetical protein